MASISSSGLRLTSIAVFGRGAFRPPVKATATERAASMVSQLLLRQEGPATQADAKPPEDRSVGELPTKQPRLASPQLLSAAATAALLRSLNEAANRALTKSVQEKASRAFTATAGQPPADTRPPRGEYRWLDYFSPVPDNTCIVL